MLIIETMVDQIIFELFSINKCIHTLIVKRRRDAVLYDQGFLLKDCSHSKYVKSRCSQYHKYGIINSLMLNIDVFMRGVIKLTDDKDVINKYVI